MSVEVTDAARLLPRRGHGSAARLRAAGKHLLGATGRAAATLSVVIVDDRGMRRLNRSYRGRDKTTDVLSFSQLEGVAIEAVGDDLLGDVVISLPLARRQAKAGGWSLEEELLRLLVHGLLHVLGYDHEESARKALRMRREEMRLCDLLSDAGYRSAREDADE